MKYVNPEMEVVILNAEDIITDSGDPYEGEEGDGQLFHADCQIKNHKLTKDERVTFCGSFVLL